jgi:hypothetical protein
MTTESASSVDQRAAAPSVPDSVAALLRHFADLRDLQHGDATTREGKEALFHTAARLLDPYAVQVLGEINEHLLLGTGTVESAGPVRDPEGGLLCDWTLSWAEQRESGLPPLTLRAFYGSGFHHPHLRCATIGEWPLNVFTEEQAAAELPTLRAIAAADLHNLVFLRDYRIVPATMAVPARLGRGFVR